MKRPNSRRNLDMALRRMGDGDASYVAIRSLIADAIVAQMLVNAVVKGGASLKMRFGDAGTRATTDLDAAASLRAEAVRGLADNLDSGWEGFTGRLVQVPQAHPHDVPEQYLMQPYEVKLSYLGQAWCTVPLELGYDEIGDADQADMVLPADANEVLTSMGFPMLNPVPLMDLHYQIAQKLHGVSEPGSQRAHDLVDLQLIMSNVDVDLAATREVCIRLFAYRQQQAWPPTIVAGEGWDGLYSEAAFGLDVIHRLDEAIAWGNCLVEKINGLH